MLNVMARAGRSVLAIGRRPDERPYETLRRRGLVVTAVSITLLSTVWTSTYLVLDRPVSAAIPFSYQVASVIGLIYLDRTRDFATFALSQLVLMLILPFLLQWSLGGFVNSSAIMVWAFASPLAALVLFTARRATVFFAAYLALAIVSGLIDTLIASDTAPLPDPLRLAFFVLNIGTVSFVVFLLAGCGAKITASLHLIA